MLSESWSCPRGWKLLLRNRPKGNVQAAEDRGFREFDGALEESRNFDEMCEGKQKEVWVVEEERWWKRKGRRRQPAKKTITTRIKAGMTPNT